MQISFGKTWNGNAETNLLEDVVAMLKKHMTAGLTWPFHTINLKTMNFSTF